MNAPSLIPMKVRAILPLCGSAIDGEALGACRAVGRVLDAAGLDFRDLAAAIPIGESAADPDQSSRRREKPCGAARFRGPIPPFNVYSWRRAYTPSQEAQNRRQVAYCQGQRWRLSPRERSFIDNIARLHGNLSVRQGDWLAVLTDRLENVGRCA